MAWFNSGNWSGLAIDPNLTDVLLDLCLACKERAAKIGITLPLYHTNDGDKSTPTRANFVGMPVWEIQDTLDDVSSAIDDLLGIQHGGDGVNWWFVDPADDTHMYTDIADVATRAGVSLPTGFDAAVAEVDVYAYYKEILDDLYLLRFVVPSALPDSAVINIYQPDEDPDPQTAWDNLRNVTPTTVAPAMNTTTGILWASFSGGALHRMDSFSGGIGRASVARAKLKSSNLPTGGALSESKMTVSTSRSGPISNAGTLEVIFQLSMKGVNETTFAVDETDNHAVSSEISLTTELTRDGSTDDEFKATWYDNLPVIVPGYTNGTTGPFGFDSAFIGVWLIGPATGKIDLTSEFVRI